jgi:hypothetical protein
MNPTQLSFVKEALAAKVPRPEIARALKEAGWPEDETATALAAYADVDFAVPVPMCRRSLSAREAFIYLLTFLCLYLAAWSFGALLFDFIGRWIPDPLNQYYGSDFSQALRLSISMLVVSFPLYLWLSSITNRWVAKEADKRHSPMRTWLTYLTLYIAAGTIIGDVITLIYNLLGGELTLRFVLKVLVVGLIAGLVFGYYLWSLRKEEKV